MYLTTQLVRPTLVAEKSWDIWVVYFYSLSYAKIDNKQYVTIIKAFS